MATGNQSDIALRGAGFFQVAGPGDQRLLTRAGSFTITPDGRLVTQESYAVLDSNSVPIAGLNPRVALDINATGEIRQNGMLAARLGIVEPENLSGLAKRGALYFSASQAGDLKPASAETLQGRLEGANMAAPAAAVRLIDVLRQFEMLQKAIQIGGQMSEQLDEIARVGN
jgi:flagellar basal body rod protein FlgG